MLTDHNLVITLVISQLPKSVFALIFNFLCCNLKQPAQSFILLSLSDITALRGISSEGSDWVKRLDGDRIKLKGAYVLIPQIG